MDAPNNQPLRPHIYGMSDMDYPNPDTLGVSIFPKTRQQPFPQELEDQFKHMQSNFSTGLFPSISRTWMAIDSDLFLWNFENNSDLAYFDGIENTILLVDLCTPRAGFSSPELHYLLVVATTVDIRLLALTFRDEFGNAQPVERTSFKTSYACLTGGKPLYTLFLEGAIVTNLCCSQNGRIFFSADDCLYELQYYDKTWYGGYTCKKINHSKSLLTTFIPALNLFSSRDEIRQVELDDSRHLLYVLFKKGNVQIFDLGSDGKSIQKFCTFQREQLEHDSTAFCNVTPEYFKEVVAVNAVPLTSSYNNYFVLTTAKGVRIYLTCLEKLIQSTGQYLFTQEHIRPKTVRIVQIKFPPSEQSFAFKGVNIYTSSISEDTCLMASDLGSDQSNFWIFTSSNFVFSNRPDEHNIVLPMHGAVWKIDKASEFSSRQSSGLDPMILPREDEPLIARQHLQPVEKFYVLTSKGVSTFSHLAPVEIFRKILGKYGTESKEFQAFISLFPQSEVCVMAIIVLCGDNPMDVSIKDVALRTFFVYGGEPQIHVTTNGIDGYSNGFGGGLSGGGASEPRPRSALGGGWNLPSHLNSPKTPFQSPRLSGLSLGPLRTSTPQDLQTPSPRFDHFANTPFSPIGCGEQTIVAGSPTIVFSPRHDALHLYFQRILSPLGDRRICYVENDLFTSSFLAEELDSVTRFVAVYKRIIEEYALISSTSSMHHSSARPHVSDPRDLAGRDQEKLSLSNLRNEIGTILEVLRLWIILLEHDFNAIITTLPSNLQKDLINWGFDDLFKNRDNVCTDLITCIVRFYIGDDASTTAISKRLRDLCPSIFTNDDALVVNATENLYRVKTTPNAKERKELIASAIKTFLQSIHKLNLVQTCDLLIQIGHFEGIVDLALAKADSDDKSKLALIFYKRQTNDVGDEAAELTGAVRKRNDAYTCITDTLELLQTVSQSSDQPISSVTLNASTFLFPSADCVKNLSAGVAKIERDAMLTRVFDSEDELANVAVFRWLLSRGMANIPLDRKCRFFKTYLLHEIEEGKGSKFLELLWKFNEKTGNYIEAAKVLFDMAARVGSRTTLSQRITQLSQALMCVQSDAETKSNSELKSEIQDTLDVAQIQMRTKNMLESQYTVRQPTDQKRLKVAVEALNHDLLSLTDIYKLYAEPFELDEIKLDVLHSGSHCDKELIEQIWKSILDRELDNFLNNSENEFSAKGRLGSLLLRMKKHFARSMQFVPCQFILRNLLIVGFKRLVESDWLPDICKTAEISYTDLLSVSSYEFRIGDPFWQQNQRALQFITDLVIVVCDRFREECRKMSQNDANLLRNACLDFISDLLLNTNKNKKAKKLEALQGELDRI